MTVRQVLILPGDGIGPEIIAQAEKILRLLVADHGLAITLKKGLIGGSAYDIAGTPLPDETLSLARQSDAILLGAVGGPKWDHVARALRPERGLLAIRSSLELFANLRPAILYSQLAHASSLKADVIAGLDLMLVRELTGGIYFGLPRGISTNEDGTRRGVNTLIYDEHEIERIARVAFELAGKRNKRVCSVDKANVLEATELWRQVVDRVAADYPCIDVQHMYVDNAAMQLVREPRQFDVILTTNMFGDILSDLASMLTGSIGMLPSASLGHKQFGMYEPAHGAAPDISGENSANPIATILSVAMMLRYSLNAEALANKVEQAVKRVLERGFRTMDICTEGFQCLSTEEMGDMITTELK